MCKVDKGQLELEASSKLKKVFIESLVHSRSSQTKTIIARASCSTRSVAVQKMNLVAEAAPLAGVRDIVS
jgi:hypothetical protein